MQAKIYSKKQIATGTLFCQFVLLKNEIVFEPGQYFFVTLPKLNYPDDRGSKRHFSIVNSPNERGVLSLATRIRESGFKKTLTELPIGSKVEVGPFAGAFVLPENTTIPLVFIAGGIGITPFISMLRFVKEEKLPFKITLIYSNKNKESAAFYEELISLADNIAGFNLIVTMTQDEMWEKEKRRVDKKFLQDYIKDLNNVLFYVAGPPSMNESIVKDLAKVGVEREKLKTENFTGY